MRALGMYTHMDDHEKMDLVNRIYACFLQAMEYHPIAKTQAGWGANHTQHEYNTSGINEPLTEMDSKNAEDMIIIALECLYEVKIYDFTVLNPVNFQMIAMAEFALQYFP